MVKDYKSAKSKATAFQKTQATLWQKSEADIQSWVGPVETLKGKCQQTLRAFREHKRADGQLYAAWHAKADEIIALQAELKSASDAKRKKALEKQIAVHDRAAEAIKAKIEENTAAASALREKYYFLIQQIKAGL